MSIETGAAVLRFAISGWSRQLAVLAEDHRRLVSDLRPYMDALVDAYATAAEHERARMVSKGEQIQQAALGLRPQPVTPQPELPGAPAITRPAQAVARPASAAPKATGVAGQTAPVADIPARTPRPLNKPRQRALRSDAGKPRGPRKPRHMNGAGEATVLDTFGANP